MCLAIPAQILTRNSERALVGMHGLELEVDVSLVPHAQVGDYVIVHVGIALSVMSTEESAAALAAHREFAALDGAGTDS